MRNTSKPSLILQSAFVSIAIAGCTGGSVSERDEALIGGTVAVEGQYPASIQIHFGVFADGTTLTKCTGAPISKRHILLAAHCVFKEIDGIQQVLGTRLSYAYGVNAEHRMTAPIKALYWPTEARQYLRHNHVWGTGDFESAHDVAIIELKRSLPSQIAIGTMSSQTVALDMPIAYGGYGCEASPLIPAEPSATENASSLARLKYAHGTVTSVSQWVAQGPTYDGLAKQSICPGDSGGPVYVNVAESTTSSGVTEFLGINSFHKRKADGDSVNSEINFSIVTKDSELGHWVDAVLKGNIQGEEP
jgi:Trypsin